MEGALVGWAGGSKIESWRGSKKSWIWNILAVISDGIGARQVTLYCAFCKQYNSSDVMVVVDGRL